MTHTNLKTCKGCAQEKLIREYRDKYRKVRAYCQDCMQVRRQRLFGHQACTGCGETKARAEFDDGHGHLRQTCKACRARLRARRSHPVSDYADPQIISALRAWR